jgi:hypothetical protein
MNIVASRKHGNGNSHDRMRRVGGLKACACVGIKFIVGWNAAHAPFLTAIDFIFTVFAYTSN